MKKTQTNLTAILCVMAMLFMSIQTFAQGDDCATAAAVMPGTGIVADGPSTGGAASNVCFTAATNADWYTWTAPGCGTIDVTSTNDPNTTDTRLSIYDGGCAALNCIDSDDDGGTGFTSQLLGVPVQAGVTYHIEWDDRWSTNGFEWDFTFNAAPPETVTTASLAGCNLTVEHTTLCATTLDLTIDDGTTTVMELAAPTPHTFDICALGLSVAPGTTITVNGFSIVIPGGPGETCGTAIAAMPGTGIVASGPAVGAGASNNCVTGATNATWYTWTAPTCGVIDITSTNDPALTDTRISIYDGDCTTLNCLDSDDDGGTGFTSEVLGTPVVAGTTYYFEWDDRWSTNGFEWDFTFGQSLDINNIGTAESIRIFVLDANGDEELLVAELLPGASIASPTVPTGSTVVFRTFPHNIFIQSEVVGVCPLAVDVDPCFGDTSDNDGDGFCDASTTCTSGTGAFNVYNGDDGTNVRQSFATTFINGPWDNMLYSDHIADMIGFSGNLLYLMDGTSGMVYSYIFNNGWLKTEYMADMSAHNIIGVTGAKALVLEADGSIDVYNLNTGAVLRDNAETAAIDGPLSGTAFSAMNIIGATSTNTFLVAEADGSTIEYSSVFGRQQHDGAGTTLSGGQNDASTFMAEAANTIGAHGRDAAAKVLILTPCAANGPLAPNNNNQSSFVVPNTTGTVTAAQELSVKVFPNPLGSASILNVDVQIGEAQTAQIRMVDVSGKLVKTMEIDQMITGQYQVDVTDLPRGIYMMTLNTNNDSKVIKVVK